MNNITSEKMRQIMDFVQGKTNLLTFNNRENYDACKELLSLDETVVPALLK